MNYAVLAPSSHNTQPWKFKLSPDEVRVYADPTRRLPVVDPNGRQLIMSCGAALFHLRLAIRYFGHADEVFLFPEAVDPDFLALVRLGRPRPMQPNELPMFHAIVRRRTSRHAFQQRPVPDEVLDSLRREAALEDTALNLIATDEARWDVAQLVERGDRAQMSDPAFRSELAAWLHPSRAASHDGMPGYARGLSELLDFATPAYSMVVRTFDNGKGVAARDRQLIAASSKLALLSTETDTPSAWLMAGQGLARVLLLACAHGISVSFLNQPIELPSLRSELRDTLRTSGFPQVLLRMGYGPEVKPTPRRSAREVLL